MPCHACCNPGQQRLRQHNNITSTSVRLQQIVNADSQRTYFIVRPLPVSLCAHNTYTCSHGARASSCTALHHSTKRCKQFVGNASNVGQPADAAGPGDTTCCSLHAARAMARLLLLHRLLSSQGQAKVWVQLQQNYLQSMVPKLWSLTLMQANQTRYRQYSSCAACV